MWHSSRIGRVRLEADGKDIVGVVAGNVQVLGAGLVVLQVQGCQLELWHLLDPLKGEAMELLSGLRKVGYVCEGSIASCREACRSQCIRLCRSSGAKLAAGGT
jgi:hypothetical protein